MIRRPERGARETSTGADEATAAFTRMEGWRPELSEARWRKGRTAVRRLGGRPCQRSHASAALSLTKPTSTGPLRATPVVASMEYPASGTREDVEGLAI